MAKEIKFYFDVYENTFNNISRDFIYGPHIQLDIPSAMEKFYLNSIKETMDSGIREPDSLSVSCYYAEDGIRMEMDGFSDKLLKAIGKFKSLRVLELSYYRLGDKNLTPFLGYFTYMEELNLSYCRITDLPLQDNMTASLKVLNLEGNGLKELPRALDRCTYLETLVMKGNPLEVLNPKLENMMDESQTTKNAQDLIKGYFEEKTTHDGIGKYKKQLMDECINPIKNYLKSDDAFQGAQPNVTLGVQLSNIPHEMNLQSSYYKHIYLSFMLYYRIYFDQKGETEVQVDEKNLFGALSNSKYEYQSRQKSGPLSVLDQYEIFFYWMFVAKPFSWSEKLKNFTTELLGLVHIFTVIKLLEEAGNLPRSKNVLNKNTIMTIRKLMENRPADPFGTGANKEQIAKLRADIRTMLNDLIPPHLENFKEYGETRAKKQIEQNVINLQKS